MTKKNIRQGDLLFVPVSEVPAQYRKAEFIQPKGLIREGEMTGHHHRLEVLESAFVYRPSNGMLHGEKASAFVDVGERGTVIVHEEHGPAKLEPNQSYAVLVAREHDYVADLTRQVWD